MTTRKTKPGAAPASPPGDDSFSLISNEKLLELYAAMLNCSLIQERVSLLAGNEQRAEFDGGGHQASAAGVAAGLLSGDALSAPRGDLATRFLKGISLPEVLSTLFRSHRNGSALTSAAEAQANILPSPQTLAGRLEAAERAARLNKRTRNRRVVALFCRREEAADIAWQESLRSAAAARLPLVFVCHGRAESEDPAQRAQDLRLPEVTVDGDDVVAIYRVASEALAHARRGNGPTLIECKLWTVEGAKRSRRTGGGDALRNMEKYLAAKGLFTRKLKAGVISQFTRELDEAVAKARGYARKPVSSGLLNRLPIR
jgi:pyruvate dehydrogenase E1 component alpha subunit